MSERNTRGPLTGSGEMHIFSAEFSTDDIDQKTVEDAPHCGSFSMRCGNYADACRIAGRTVAAIYAPTVPARSYQLQVTHT